MVAVFEKDEKAYHNTSSPNIRRIEKMAYGGAFFGKGFARNAQAEGFSAFPFYDPNEH